MPNQFSRTETLLGTDALSKLQHSHIAIFGLGGVGGYALEALARSGVQKFDIIVSNPPYIPFDTALEEEVLKEPHNALFADEQGLYFYKKIIQNAPQYLNLKGILAFEIGHNQADYIKEFLIQNNFSNIKIIKDLSGFDRIIMAQIL